MGYIPVDSLIADMTPAQKILMQQFYSNFDSGGGVANKKIINIEPYYYQGGAAGGELTVYAATKMYICLELDIAGTANGTWNNPGIHLWDETNTEIFNSKTVSMYWDTTAIAVGYAGIAYKFTNFYFSRFSLTGNGSYYKFIGYRVTLQ